MIAFIIVNLLRYPMFEITRHEQIVLYCALVDYALDPLSTQLLCHRLQRVEDTTNHPGFREATVTVRKKIYAALTSTTGRRCPMLDDCYWYAYHLSHKNQVLLRTTWIKQLLRYAHETHP